jgi:YHS domain-containing protein
MPSYDGLLAPAQLDALSEWILTRPAVRPTDSPAEVAEDPICHMQVRITPDALSAVIAGETHYFCAASCRERFVKAHAAAPAPPPGSSAR